MSHYKKQFLKIDQSFKQLPEMDYLTLLLALLHVYRALCEEVLWHTSVPFAENMSLECVYPSVGILTQVEWFKIGTEKDSIAIFSPTHGMVIRKPYAERVYFLNSTMASNNMTLFFRNASEDDVGYYSCSLYIYPQGTWQKVIQVVQSDGFEAAVPPNSHIVSEPGKNITLTCQPQMTWPVQEVRWEKIQPRQIDLLTYCDLVHGRNFTSKFPRQIVSNCSHGRWSFIVIPDVTASDSGLYRCYLQASAGENETFVMRLTVAEEGEGEKEAIYIQSPGIHRRHPRTIEAPSLPVNLPINPWMIQERIFMSTIQPSLVDQRLEFKLILDMSALIMTLMYSCMDCYAIFFHYPWSTLDTSCLIEFIW
ncbi:CD226 antigen isoform X1 [Rhinopithecus roxellana]|uniref:CD226 antigen isoform X1 n=1 Tax=Rhinopithecus roxellana TaxID=61622 RepID=UPI00123744F9|nr:CD226 antigen isoform X1 [Rhinopithecus roxellana]XP_030781585.1 CD226 antigen isoform X1 [Rhinopithecus roxellana]XP_030781586.1 CD226 antigen isoform X1 [Rhinopithecus roxellana]XP_030781587.1 CD226 antigen isoform X1 [Rhinopithecus roxellana]